MNTPQEAPRQPIMLGGASNPSLSDEDLVRREEARLHEARRRAAQREQEEAVARSDHQAAYMSKWLQRRRIRNGFIALAGVLPLLVIVSIKVHSEGTLMDLPTLIFFGLALILVVCVFTMSPSPKTERSVVQYRQGRKRAKRAERDKR